jgi:hypothetical protein
MRWSADNGDSRDNDSGNEISGGQGALAIQAPWLRRA